MLTGMLLDILEINNVAGYEKNLICDSESYNVGQTYQVFA